MRIELFGTFAALNGGEAIDRFPTHRAKVLLAYLACHREAHSRGLLAEMLWPGGNPDAIRFRLNQTVAEIRKTLRPLGESIESDRFSLQLHPEVTTDLDEFHLLLRSAAADELNVQTSLVKAVEITDRRFLNGIAEDWVSTASDHISLLRLGALRRLTDSAVGQGNHDDAVRYTRQALKIDPYEELLHQRLLTSLLALGKRAEALREFHEFEQLLRDDFAMAPSDATRAIVVGIQVGESPARKPRLGSSDATGRSARQVVDPLKSSGSISDVLETYIRAGDSDRAMRFAASLLIYWNLQGELITGKQWLKRIFLMPNAMSAPPDARCAALIVYGITLVSTNDFKASTAALTRALEIANGIGHPKQIADALQALGHSALRKGELDLARRYFEQSLKFFEEASDPSGIADSLNGLGESLRFACRYQDSEIAHRKAQEIRIRIGRPDRAAHSMLNLGIVASRTGNYEKAVAYFRESLVTLRTFGSPSVIADTLMEIAGAHAFQGHPVQATRLLSAVSHLRQTVTIPIPTADRPDYVRFLTKARDQLDRDNFAKEWEQGQTMTRDEAIEYASVPPRPFGS